KVDAAMMTNLGLSTLRLSHPDLKLIADLRTPQGCLEYLGAEEYPSLCLVARKAWLDPNIVLARLFGQAFLNANRWMAAHSAEQTREALPPTARAADAAADIEAIRGMLPTLNTTGRISDTGAQAVYRVTRESVPRLRDASIDVGKTYINPDF